jgi:N-acetylneuraminic acid mutarotase
MATGPSGDVVLFGGAGSSGADGDMWSYDPGSGDWKKLNSTGDVPPALYGAALAYDPSAEDFVLFAGQGSTSSFSDATYAYTPATGQWARLATPPSPPPARTAPGVSYDPVDNSFIVFGGWTGSVFLDDTWRLPW